MAPFPTFSSVQHCQEECVGILSSCVLEGTGEYVCQMNALLFLGAIFLAVLTGVGVPILMLVCYLSDRCRFPFFRRSSDLERQQLNPKSVLASVSCSDEATGSVIRHDITRYPGTARQLSNSGVRF